VPHVFNRFFRGDTPRNAQGTGLGLSIVKSIMQLHDGTVTVNSETGKGTEIVLGFPEAKQTKQPPLPHAATASARRVPVATN
jgi:signal transduction histidine kinase